MNIFQKWIAFNKKILSDMESTPSGQTAVEDLNAAIAGVESQLVSMAKTGVDALVNLAPGVGGELSQFNDAYWTAVLAEIGKHTSVPISPAAPAPEQGAASPASPASQAAAAPGPVLVASTGMHGAEPGPGRPQEPAPEAAHEGSAA